MVRLLKHSGNVVAMTGDGVNDAPALKAADIGVAMGITGTEVSKEAAVMILTDDNFATIVNAVEYGRALYDNLLKYLRFQMSTLVAYIAIFIGAGILAIAGGVPLTPLQILWINMVIDIPIAVALGFDEPTGGLMGRPPRPVGAPVLSRANWVRLCAQGFVMTIGALVAYQLGHTQTRPCGRRHHAADHPVAVPCGRRPAGPRPAQHHPGPLGHPRTNPAAPLRHRRCWPSSPSPPSASSSRSSRPSSSPSANGRSASASPSASSSSKNSSSSPSAAATTTRATPPTEPAPAAS